MRKTLFYFQLFISTGLFIACNGESDTPSEPKDKSNVDSTVVADSVGADVEETVFEVKELDQVQIDESIEVNGDMVDELVYEDRSGIHYLIISEYEEGEFFSEGYVSQLWATQWLVVDGLLEEEWQIKDFNQEVYEGVSYIPNTLELTDVNGDGSGETSFIYEIAPDGLDPSTVKLLMHVENEKLAIRGQLGVDPNDFDEMEEKNIDAVFEKKGEAFKTFASEKWDNYRDWLKKLINDELSEEEEMLYR